MGHSEVTARILFDWESLSREELDALCSDLPRKILRWLGAHHPDNRTRKVFFRKTGVKIGSRVVINPGFLVEDSYRELVSIGDRASIAPNVMVIADAAPNNSRLAEIRYVVDHLIVEKAITIEADAWIGAAAVLLPGVTVGRGAIVGAGSIVNRDVPAFVVVAGVPARHIRTLEPFTTTG
jgi:acetyltransferase-like isoleucine patch superfamily enzyme